MRDYLKQFNAVEANLEMLKTRGVLSSNPNMVAMEAEVSRLKSLIDQYTKDFQSMQWALAANPSDNATRASLVPQYQHFHHTMDVLQTELADTNRRIETLQIEGTSVDRRLTVISPGDVPASPYKDRRLLFAIVGGLGGAILPTMAFALLGMSSGRIRYSDDAHHQDAMQSGLLGILPMLPKQMANPLLASVGAHCVHQLRMRLQLMPDKRVFMITSSTPREGKSSLTMALGLSFAAAGKKTLMIDSDTAGRTLTFRLCAAHEPGLMSAIADPDAANLKSIDENLWLLPVGHRRELAGAELSPGVLDELISTLREKFDYILIDSGPILASLEASAIARSADSVILAISQGQHGSLVRRSFHTLRTINAPVAGYVFNRAMPQDCDRNLEKSSSRYTTARKANANRPLPERFLRTEYAFSPLAQSVTYFRQKAAITHGDH